MSGNERREIRAFVALGSNIDPELYLPRAIQLLSEVETIRRISSVYESPPVDGSPQANYLNSAVLVSTTRSAEQLCREILPGIEARLGRVRDPRNRHAPRTIDLDLVLYDAAMLTIDHRQIPDPEIAERAFLAIPLAELQEEFIVPSLGRSLRDLAAPHRASNNLIPRPDVVLRDDPRTAQSR